MTRLEDHLSGLAQSGQTITYGALARDLGWHMAELTAALERLMEGDAAAGQPLRAALCTGRLAQGMPASGFFLKAAELGYDLADPAGFVADQRARLFKA